MAMKVATAAQMQEMDRIAICDMGISSLTLMERAAGGIVQAVCGLTEQNAALHGERRRAAVFVGPGNNGGDGTASARLLAARGWEVAVFLAGDREKLTPDHAAMAARLKEVGLEMRPFPREEQAVRTLELWCASCDVFVDALFGVGLCRSVGGVFAEAIALMNRFTEIPTVSADIASGLSADTGEVLGSAVLAAVTVTFSLAKPGQFAGQGWLYTGKLIIHDIGIPAEAIRTQTLTAEVLDEAFVLAALPVRDPDGHKGMFGRDYILAGSIGFTGAPVLAARACVRTGAGLVTVGTPASAYPIVAGKCLEEMPYPLPEHDGRAALAGYDGIRQKIAGCDAALIGPGMGRGVESDALICRLTAEISQPLILDADGINAVSAHIDSLDGRRGRVTVLTPHDGEFARLGGDVTHGGRIRAARDFACAHGCVLVLKGHRTIIAAPDGRIAINTTGNSGMAKGGSGDALSGMLLALLGQGVPAYEAACSAVWLHGRAGDLAAASLGEHGMLPSDLIGQISHAILLLEKK